MNPNLSQETEPSKKINPLHLATIALAACLTLEAENIPAIAAPVAIARSIINLV